MTALAANHGFDRAETARWTLCFAAVVAAHGVAAAWFLPSHDVTSEFDAGAAVVMLELPEVQATSATPPNDLAPGPPEAESAPTPPKEEQTKPPEQEAEVALPIPEPPTPAPPTVASPPTAQPSVTMPAVAALPTPGAEVVPATIVRRWESTLVAHIERFKRYPAEAQMRHQEGTPMLRFTMTRDGRVLSFGLANSSGHELLDQEAMSLMERAQPLPPLPPEVPQATIQLVVPLRFQLR